MFEYEYEADPTVKEYLVVDFDASRHSVFTAQELNERYEWMQGWAEEAQIGEFNKSSQLLFVRIV